MTDRTAIDRTSHLELEQHEKTFLDSNELNMHLIEPELFPAAQHLRDENSNNGTLVNGQKIDKRRVQTGANREKSCSRRTRR